MTMAEILTWLRERSEEFKRFNVHVDGARFTSELLTMLETALVAEAETLLTLSQAAARSGMSEEHLGRLLRQGRIPNAGRRGRPRLRVSDLPRKAPRISKRMDELAMPAYNPDADARSLVSRRRGGANGNSETAAK